LWLLRIVAISWLDIPLQILPIETILIQNRKEWQNSATEQLAMNGYTYYVCDIATKFNYYDRQNSSFECWFMCPTVNCHWASYISTNSIPVNRRRYQSSRPWARYSSRGFPQMNITSKPGTTIFARSLPVYRALSTPSNTDTNQTTFCNVNATSGQSCS